MAYIINKFNGQQLIVLEDGTIDTTTSLALVGRNYVGYGEVQNENFVYLLENFANISPPSRPLEGQIWFDTQKNIANIYDGINWHPIGNAEVLAAAPSDPNLGMLWFDSNSKQLKIYNNGWQTIGPESIAGFGITKATSTTLDDISGDPKPVILLQVNDSIIAICSAEAFTINSNNLVNGFENTLIAGINLSSNHQIKGNLLGNATAASKLITARLINGTPFDGQNNITVKASTTNKLVKGTYILGSDFDGSSEITWSVDATSSNIIGKIVARNSEGGFSAGTITGTFVGNLTGNVTSNSGTSSFNIVQASSFIGATFTGNSSSASQLAVGRRINGVLFDATTDITVPAAAATLTGSTLNPTITLSNLTSLGTLSSLAVADVGINIGSSGSLKLLIDSSIPTLRSTAGRLDIDLGQSAPSISFVNAANSVSLGGPNAPAIVGDNTINLGINGYKFNKIYANDFVGISVETDSLTPSIGAAITVNGDVIITGNLYTEGTVTAVNTTEITIVDKLINLASTATTEAAANGAGIYINGANASLTYSSVGNKWVLNKFLDMGANDVQTTGLFRGTATSAQYADLAENYVADKQYEPGTVLELGGEYEVTIAQDETRRVVGVVSENPAYLMNSGCKGQYVVSVALQGRVPCKVRGKIRKGDMMVSGGDGYARPTADPKLGTIIGKSLENFEGSDGIIEILVGRV